MLCLSPGATPAALLVLLGVMQDSSTGCHARQQHWMSCNAAAACVDCQPAWCVVLVGSCQAALSQLALQMTEEINLTITE